MNNGRTHWEGCHEHHLECALAKLAKCERDAERYQIVRRMNAAQFADAFILNIRTGKPFDEIIDDLGPFYKAARGE